MQRQIKQSIQRRGMYASPILGGNEEEDQQMNSITHQKPSSCARSKNKKNWSSTFMHPDISTSTKEQLYGQSHQTLVKLK